MSVTIQFRRDDAADWAASNHILNGGELGIESDTGRAKLGDGSTAWNALPYWNTNNGPLSVNGQTGTVVLTAANVGADAVGAAASALASAQTFATNAVATEATRALTAEAQLVPQVQSFALASNTYSNKLLWTVTGQTGDPLPPFGWTLGSQTYSWYSGGETTQGPMAVQGYNPRKGSGQTGLTSAETRNGSMVYSMFADAGDSWNPATGGHGLEANWGCFLSPNGLVGVNMVECVAVNDNTGTATLGLRCGTGRFLVAGGASYYVSQMTAQDTGGNTYWECGPFNSAQAYNGGSGAATQPGMTILAPVSMGNQWYTFQSSPGNMTWLIETLGAAGSGALAWTVLSVFDALTATWEAGRAVTFTMASGSGYGLTTHWQSGATAIFTMTAAGSGNNASMGLTSAAGTALLTLNGNVAGASAQIAFQKNGTTTWLLEDVGGSNLYLTNNSGAVQMLFVSGANSSNYNAATTYILTKTLNYGSLVVNNGGTALAATATDGYLYSPAITVVSSSTPTGVPTAQAGAAAGPVVDAVNMKVWYYVGGGWHYHTLT